MESGYEVHYTTFKRSGKWHSNETFLIEGSQLKGLLEISKHDGRLSARQFISEHLLEMLSQRGLAYAVVTNSQGRLSGNTEEDSIYEDLVGYPLAVVNDDIWRLLRDNDIL